MTADELEFSLSQYADGTLPDGERSAVEAVLAVDPAARRAVDEHRRLNDLLLSPPGDVSWDRLATFLSASVSEADGVAGRIMPARRFPLWRSGAIAAAAAVAVTVGLLAHRGRPSSPAVGPVPSDAVAIVTGPAVESGTGPVEALVTIGPSPALAARAGSWRYAEGVIERQSTAVIAAAPAVPERDLRYR